MTRAAFADEVGVRDTNSVRHAQWPETKWEAANRRLRIFSGPERTQSDFVQAQHGREPTEFVATQVRTVIDRINDAPRRKPCPQRQHFMRERGATHRFFKHVADLVF